MNIAQVAEQLIETYKVAAQGDPKLDAVVEKLKLLKPEELIQFMVQNSLISVQETEPTLVDQCFDPPEEASVLEKINSLDPALINTKGAFDVTLLHEAACRGYLEASKRLLELGIDRTALNTLGETAAQRCRAMGYTEIANLIESN